MLTAVAAAAAAAAIPITLGRDMVNPLNRFGRNIAANLQFSALSSREP